MARCHGFASALWAIGLGLAVARCADPDPAPDRAENVGQVVVALSSLEVCDAHCVCGFVPTLVFDDNANATFLGSDVGCGGTFAFRSIAGGRQVHVALEAFDCVGTVILRGESPTLTVASGAETPAVVRLEPLTRPTITAIVPDPIAVQSASVSIEIAGRDLGLPEGLFGVDVGGIAAPTKAWNNTRITAEVAAGTSGDALTITRCGIASEPAKIRLVGTAIGRRTLPRAPCPASQHTTALAVDAAGNLMAGFACSDRGFVERFTLAPAGDPNCPGVHAATWEVASAPTALAANNSTAWVAVANGIVEIDLAAPQATTVLPVTIPVTDPITALAATDDSAGVWALAATHIMRVRPGALEAVTEFGTRTVTALAHARGSVFAVGTDLGNPDASWLAVLKPESGALVSFLALTECPSPVAVDASTNGTHIIVACGGAHADRVLAVTRTGSDATSRTIGLGGGTVTSLALDAAGSAALVWRGAEGRADIVSVGATGPAAVVGGWSALGAGTELLRVGTADWFAIANEGDLEVWSPYAPTGPCSP